MASVGVAITGPSNKGMKLTKLSAAQPSRRKRRSAGGAAECPRRRGMDAGTASQLIPGVRRTVGERRLTDGRLRVELSRELSERAVAATLAAGGAPDAIVAEALGAWSRQLWASDRERSS